MPRIPLSQTQHSLPTPHGDIPYLLLRTARRRSMEIRVDPAQGVRVSAPRYTPLAEIHSFLRQKSDWIARKTAEAARRRKTAGRKYHDGAEFLFLGVMYPLSIRETARARTGISFGEEGWEVGIPAGADDARRQKLIREKLVDWYRRQAEEVFGGRVFHFARVMGTEPLKITVRTQKRIWGSCHPQSKSINLNWTLVMAPIEVVDYVVVHELAHLAVPNHSRRFWRRVESILPDYRHNENWLKEHSGDMVLPA